MNRQHPIIIATLADYQTHKYTLSAYCGHCNHSHDVPFKTLIAAFGPDCDLPANRSRILRRLICSHCGRPADSLIVGVPRPLIQSGAAHALS